MQWNHVADSTKIDNTVRVLVVEDDPYDSELLLLQLHKKGVGNQVKFISNGQEALDFLTRPEFSSEVGKLIAIFLDLKLPLVGGLDLLRHIRTRKELQGIPVIVMTSSNDPKDIEECRKLKVTSYISKPITFPSFSKAVADVFHSSKAT